MSFISKFKESLMSFIDKFKKSLGFSRKEKKPKLPDFPEDESPITPDPQPYYEIIVIRPESMDDMDYIFNQILSEENPVIVDFNYFEREGEETLDMAKEKIDILKQEHDVNFVILCYSQNKNIFLFVPSRINIVEK
ncbi:MAG: cell division protein SepF [Methanobrevibacter sp.]|nr:cell division protein SepF [Methanobrevibacter sp.]